MRSARRILGTGCALTVLLACPAAHGSTVSMPTNEDRLVYTADPGEANSLHIRQAGATVEVVDGGARITAGENCVTTSDYRALCRGLTAHPPAGDADGGGPSASSIYLADRDDEFTVSPDAGLGNIAVDAGPGDDRVEGSGDRRFFLTGGDGIDRLVGSSGDDLIDGGADADFVKGRGGLDWAYYTSRLAGITVTLDNQANDGEPGEGDNVQTENVFGGDGDDQITGNVYANTLFGGAGRDTLRGDGGDDLLDGNRAEDHLSGGAGNDLILLWGERRIEQDSYGNGNYVEEPSADRVRCGSGDDVVEAGSEDSAVPDCEQTRWGAGPGFSLPPERRVSPSDGRLTLRLKRTAGDGSSIEGPVALRTRSGTLLARGAFPDIKVRESADVVLRLTKRGRRLLARRGSVRARATATVRNQGRPEERTRLSLVLVVSARQG
jgi:hypothetical protein